MAKSEVDKELAKSLLAARKKPRNFAMIAKGVTILKLMLSKKPFRDAELLDAKKEAKGNLVIVGVCTAGDGPDLLFRVSEEPPLQDAKLKAFVKEETGLGITPRFVIDPKLTPVIDDSSDAENELGEGATSGNVPPLPSSTEPTATASAPPSLSAIALEFTQRLKSLKPDLDKVLGSAASTAGEAKLRASEAALLARKGDYSGALALLLQLETLVATGLNELAGSATTGLKDAAAQFNTRFKSLMPSIKQAADAGTTLGLEIAKLAKEAAALARESGLSAANLVLDQIESRLRTLAGEESGEGEIAFRERWQGLLDYVGSLVALSRDDRATVEQRISEARRVGEAGDLSAAHSSLDEIDSFISQLLGNLRRQEAESVVPEGKVAIEKTKIRWHDFRVRSLAGFQELIDILREYDEEDDREVIGILGELTQGLPADVDTALESLDRAVNARDPQAVSASKQALAAKLDDLKQYLERHRDTLETCEENPHQVAVALVQPMEETIDEISGILSQL